jgi:hypothetical protein
MADESGIDPRHDPIFQRGYDPEVHGEPAPGDQPRRRSRVRRPLSEDVARFAPPGAHGPFPPAEVDRAAGGEATTGWAMPPKPSGASPSAASFSVGSADSAAAASAEHADPEADPRDTAEPHGAVRDAERTDAAPWRNPYLLGLVIGGAVLALAGYQMFRAALETIYVDFAESNFFFGGTESSADESADPTGELVAMQLGWSLGPLLVLLGIGAILSVLVFVAVRWRPEAGSGSARQGRRRSAAAAEVDGADVGGYPEEGPR